MYLLVSLLQLNALVVGNGSYILQSCGHDLHSLTIIFLVFKPQVNGIVSLTLIFKHQILRPVLKEVWRKIHIYCPHLKDDGRLYSEIPLVPLLTKDQHMEKLM